MKMMTPCLMTGPFDWSEERMPRAEFDARLARVRAAMRERGVERLVVHGNAFDHGALAWLTNFTPKLGPAFALVPREGPMRMLFSGGPGMLSSAQRLTFVEDVATLRGVGADVSRWLGEPRDARLRLGLCEGSSMALDVWAALTGLVSNGGAIVEMDTEIDTMRREKSPRELRAMKDSIDVLRSTMRTFARSQQGLGRRAAMISGEAAANALGAQDARFRLSDRSFGPPAPFDGNDVRITAPVGAAVAVRCAGYWAVGQGMFGAAPTDAKARAREALLDAVSRLRADARCDNVRVAALDVTISGHGVGLSLEEGPRIGEKGGFIEGEVCNIAASLETGEGEICTWSALVCVEEDAGRLLWAAPDLDISLTRD